MENQQVESGRGSLSNSFEAISSISSQDDSQKY